MEKLVNVGPLMWSPMLCSNREYGITHLPLPTINRVINFGRLGADHVTSLPTLDYLASDFTNLPLSCLRRSTCLTTGTTTHQQSAKGVGAEERRQRGSRTYKKKKRRKRS